MKITDLLALLKVFPEDTSVEIFHEDYDDSSAVVKLTYEIESGKEGRIVLYSK